MRWLLLLVCALPAQAHDLELVEGCNAIFTVQRRNCVVSHFFFCDEDGPRFNRRLDVNKDGVFRFQLIDSEGRLAERLDHETGVRTVPGTEYDAFSAHDILVKGNDHFDYELRTSEGVVIRHTGYEEVTGETVELSGMSLLRATISSTVSVNGRLQETVEATDYIWPYRRIFLGGKASVTLPSGEIIERDETPVDIVDRRFGRRMSGIPRYGCTLELTRAVPLVPSDPNGA